MIRANFLIATILSKPSAIKHVIKLRNFSQLWNPDVVHLYSSKEVRCLKYNLRKTFLTFRTNLDRRYYSSNKDKNVETSSMGIDVNTDKKDADQETSKLAAAFDEKDQANATFVTAEVEHLNNATVNASRGSEIDDGGETVKPAVAKAIPVKSKKEKFNHSMKSVDRNFVTAVRAMNEYLLKPSDLEGLRKTYRRSPYENTPPITVYLRKDIEEKSLEVWGSQAALEREVKKRQEQDRQYREHIFQIKLTVKEYRQNEDKASKQLERKDSLFQGSGKVVLTAIAINASNFLMKLLAWLYTGSHSLFAETIHSLADTCNQLILAYGVHKSIQAADSDHPYGYTNMRYVASLISGVGIFCFGTGLNIYHGVMGLLTPETAPPLFWAFFILGGSLVSEGATLLVAINSIRTGSKQAGMTFNEYVLRAQDPLVNVVLLEDIAAVLGVSTAAVCMGVSAFLNSSVPDAVGSILIGGLLGVVALFIINTNSAALVGRSIPAAKLNAINSELENDVMIRAIHDAKCIDMGNASVRYKAEVDFDGRELTRSYLDKQDLDMLLEEMQNMKTIDEIEVFMLRHGENVIDLVGAEIDRIEFQLKKKHPQIRHCDLEIL